MEEGTVNPLGALDGSFVEPSTIGRAPPECSFQHRVKPRLLQPAVRLTSSTPRVSNPTKRERPEVEDDQKRKVWW